MSSVFFSSITKFTSTQLSSHYGACGNIILPSASLGYFDCIPLELKFMVFSYLPVKELSVLAITSKALRNYVELYRDSEKGHRHIFNTSAAISCHSSQPTQDVQLQLLRFSRCGLLLKRSTCLYSTRDRLRLVANFLNRFVCTLVDKHCPDPQHCLALSCYGRLLKTFTAGWDEKECMRTFETITQHSRMARQLEVIVKNKMGAFPKRELLARLFYRRVFLDECDTEEEKAFWLNLILKPFPIVHQARIVYLLYAPLAPFSSSSGSFLPVDSTSVLQWYMFCEMTATSRDHAQFLFKDLASSFVRLHVHSLEWSEDSVLSVIDELINIGDVWLPENVASLLYFCGETIVLKVLTSKAINGRITELANIITSLCPVCRRQGQSMSWILGVVTSVCTQMDNTRDKLELICAIADTFRDIVLDLHDFDDPDTEEQSGRDLELMVSAMSELMKDLMLKAFKPLIGSQAIAAADREE